MKELPVEWYVFREDWNSKQIINYNIFEHVNFVVWCAKDIKKHKNEYFTLESLIKRELMYYFWSKCEMEVIITDFFRMIVEIPVIADEDIMILQ